MAGTAKASIEAVGVGSTSATFTTTKDSAKEASVDIKIRVKSADGQIKEWLMLPLVNYYGISESDYGFKYPISVFRGDRVIIQQGVCDFNRQYSEKNITFLSVNATPFNETNGLIIKNSKGDRIGKFERLNGYVDDRSSSYNAQLMELVGKNWDTQTNMWFGKRELWIIFDDAALPNEQITVTLSSLWNSATRWYNPKIYLDYHGDITRDEAITAGIKILDGNTDPNA